METLRMHKARIIPREMFVAAKDGDVKAMKTLLRLKGHGALASEVNNKSVSPRAQRMITALVCHVGTEWEDDLHDLAQIPVKPGSHSRRYEDEEESP